MAGFPEPLKTLIEELGRLPGIGTRTAERLAFFLLKSETEEALALARAIEAVKRELRPCRECLNFAEGELCAVCSDPRRDRTSVMVVESPKELVAFERLGRFKGVYHVLLGRLSPHEGTGARHVAIPRLVERVKKGEVREVILATNPDAEGDGTALAVARALAGTGVPVTRLARGLPTGSTIEYAGTEILADALEGRRALPSEDARGGD